MYKNTHWIRSTNAILQNTIVTTINLIKEKSWAKTNHDILCKDLRRSKWKYISSQYEYLRQILSVGCAFIRSELPMSRERNRRKKTHRPKDQKIKKSKPNPKKSYWQQQHMQNTNEIQTQNKVCVKI